MQFRRAVASDVALLKSLEARCFGRSWPRGYVAHELAAPMSEFWLAFIAEQACGFLHFWAVAGEGSLLSMAVVPEARRKGLGRALMATLERRLIELGCSEVHLEHRVGNHAAHGLYRSVGFTECGLRKGYYADTGEDALLLSRRLDTAGHSE